MSARTALFGALAALALASAPVAHADTLYMKVDGVNGDAPETQPLGKGAFQIYSFTLSTENSDSGKAGSVKDAHFDMPVRGAAVQLFELAAAAKSVPKATFVSVDDEGKPRYRVDFEGVTVSGAGFQTLGNRDALGTDIGFQRLRITYGEGKTATVTGWDRVNNKAWK
jgi:type VI protein secretion system component Hcp